MTGRMWVPEAPLPTWEDALAHAKMLRERGVDVSIDERLKWILIRGTDGERHDPDDGTPASQCFHPDGTPMWISHYTDGWRHDPAGGTPAFQWFYSDGAPMTISHWTNGKLVSEESFPPPTGEA